MQDEYWPLAEAVALALVHGGAGVMDSPNRLLAYIADLIDPECDEMRALMLLRLCNSTMLGFYRDALGRGPGALSEAEARARDYLENECVIEPRVATAISQAFSKGFVRFQGALPSFQILAQSQAKVQPKPEASPQSLRRSSESLQRHNGTIAIMPTQRDTADGLHVTDIADAVLGRIGPQRYTGRPLCPEPKVFLRGAELVPGLDYTLSYYGNVGSRSRESVATVMATGVGAYSGSSSATFTILPREGRWPSRGKDVTVDLEVTAAEARSGVQKRMAYDLPSAGRRESCVVRVPSGSTNGNLVRVHGMGDHGTNGGERGDLVVRLVVARDRLPVFTNRTALPLVAGLVSAGTWHTVGLRTDGTAVATGYNGYGRCDVSGWSDLVAVSAGDGHTVGLRSDGTAVATGWNDDGQCDVSGWRDLVAVSAGLEHTVGLRSDGTAVATGYNDHGRCDVSHWRDLVAVSAGGRHTVGLRSDGNAVATGDNGYGQCDVSGWTGLVAVSAGGWHTVGLRSDGTAVATGYNYYGQCDVSGWTGLVAVSAGWGHTVGLRSDGTAVATGYNDHGRCDVSGWHDLVAVSAGWRHTVGLRSDGTVVATGDNGYGQCDVSGW